MGIFEIVVLAFALSMDAFAVAICKGLNMRRINYSHALVIALFFGGFQALMPFLGWLLGMQFEAYISGFDHWIAFGLLAFIGGKMLYDVFFGKDDEEDDGDKLNVKSLLMLSLATSIDALAVGLTFAILRAPVLLSVSVIGIITFVLSFVGVVAGNFFGARYQRRAEIAGGFVLILIGFKILLEHTVFA